MKIKVLDCAFSYYVAIVWFARLENIVDVVTLLHAFSGGTCVIDSSIFFIRKMCATVSDDVSICRTR